jgi:hypothetical protein
MVRVSLLRIVAWANIAVLTVSIAQNRVAGEA